VGSRALAPSSDYFGRGCSRPKSLAMFARVVDITARTTRYDGLSSAFPLVRCYLLLGRQASSTRFAWSGPRGTSAWSSHVLASSTRPSAHTPWRAGAPRVPSAPIDIPCPLLSGCPFHTFSRPSCTSVGRISTSTLTTAEVRVPCEGLFSSPVAAFLEDGNGCSLKCTADPELRRCF